MRWGTKWVGNDVRSATRSGEDEYLGVHLLGEVCLQGRVAVCLPHKRTQYRPLVALTNRSSGIGRGVGVASNRR